MGLHQALSLPRHLLLQGLQDGLEVLARGVSTGPEKVKTGESLGQMSRIHPRVGLGPRTLTGRGRDTGPGRARQDQAKWELI